MLSFKMKVVLFHSTYSAVTLFVILGMMILLAMAPKLCCCSDGGGSAEQPWCSRMYLLCCFPCFSWLVEIILGGTDDMGGQVGGGGGGGQQQQLLQQQQRPARPKRGPGRA